MVKLAKIKIDHDKMREALGLPDDVDVTSVYTKRHNSRGRREPHSFVYISCDRFDEIDEWDTAPEISFRDAKNGGMWDEENNA